jgi:predicted S18 family serine protease
MIAVLLASISGAAVVGTSTIRAPAVILYNNTGSLTTITLTITNGSGRVNFTNSSEIANDTRVSADIAARYASTYLGKNFSHYNFTYSIHDNGNNVSGPSAGAAMTLLAVSAFQNKPLRDNFTITGTISPDGTIGQIGGAIDKVSVAAMLGLHLVLVPAASPGGIEQGIYYIAQTEYKIPVVEVANISQAASYAFGTSSGIANEIQVNFSGNYNVAGLAENNLSCSNGCDESPFQAFTNHTIAITQGQIANLSAAGFGTAASQLTNVTDQTIVLHNKGYLYIAADISFLNYLDAFYLSSYNLSRSQAVASMQNIQSGCTSLTAPQLTTNNYEYIIGAELRQGWANYSINSTISGFNVSGATRDDIVTSMYSAGEAQAWCSAVSFLYDYPYAGNGAPVTFSQSLSQLAIQRINRAEPYPGMYLTLAKQADKAGNYPIAIIDADYAYSLSVSTQSFGTNASQLSSQSIALASNSTYGVWATEFGKEAYFYAYESSASNSSTQAKFYADQAYSSALLASLLSNDTQSIYASLVAAPVVSMPTDSGSSGDANVTYGSATLFLLDNLTAQVQQLTLIVAVILILLAGSLMLVIVLSHKVLVLSVQLRKGKGRKGR